MNHTAFVLPGDNATVTALDGPPLKYIGQLSDEGLTERPVCEFRHGPSNSGREAIWQVF